MAAPAGPYVDQLDGRDRFRLHPSVAEFRRQTRSPSLSLPTGGQAAYALLPRLEAPAKPIVYASLRALAERIHRDRGQDALELRDDRVRFRDHVRAVTEVIARDAGGRARRIGFAWHAGRPREALEAALAALVPNAGVEG